MLPYLTEKSIKHRIYAWTITTVLCLLFCLPANAQERYDEYEVKAAFLYNLTNFIYWPEESFVSQGATFKIVILGDSPIHSFLQNMTQGEQVDTHPIEITHINDIDELGSAHMLFISQDYQEKVNEILPHTQTLGLLTVSDFQDFNRAGGGIALLKKKNRLLLHLNKEAIEYNGLRCSSKLLQLAKIWRAH